MRAIGQFAVVLALGLSGCEKKDSVVRLGPANYQFTRSHITAFVAPEDSVAHEYYIRLRPRNYFLLVHAPRRTARANKQARGTPTIAHVNDIPGQFDVLNTDAGIVVCEKKPPLFKIFTCGFNITDNGLIWSVIIPRELVASAPAIKARAEQTLEAYRTEPRLRSTLQWEKTRNLH